MRDKTERLARSDPLDHLQFFGQKAEGGLAVLERLGHPQTLVPDELELLLQAVQLVVLHHPLVNDFVRDHLVHGNIVTELGDGLLLEMEETVGVAEAGNELGRGLVDELLVQFLGGKPLMLDQDLPEHFRGQGQFVDRLLQLVLVDQPFAQQDRAQGLVDRAELDKTGVAAEEEEFFTDEFVAFVNDIEHAGAAVAGNGVVDLGEGDIAERPLLDWVRHGTSV